MERGSKVVKQTNQLKRDKVFGSLIDDSLKRTPNKIAAICNGERITYANLDANANRAAQALLAGGMGSQEHVGIISFNCIDYIEIMLACARIDAVAVNINWRLSPRELYNLLIFNDVKIAFIQNKNDQWKDELEKLLAGKVVLINLAQENSRESEYDRLLSQQSDERPNIEVDPKNVMAHFHTSGTTGTPKCVMHTHFGFVSEILCCKDILGFSDKEVFQVMSQFFHVACVGTYMCLHEGGTVVIFSNFDADQYLTSVEQEKVTRLSAIPTVLNWLLRQMQEKQYDLSSVETINYSTCSMPPRLMQEALGKLHSGFFQSYGMTEMASIVTVLDKEDHFRDHSKHLHSVGRPIPGCRVKIIAEDGHECSHGEIGEILIQGPSMMKGYYKNSAVFPTNIMDGWFYSGDIGYLDQEGYLYLNGRRSDMLISGGENIYPKEIEDCIMTKIQDVSEAAVFGIPDDQWGEVACACVVLQPGSNLTPDELRTYLRNNLAHYKVPKKIVFVNALPKNASGKVEKKNLAKQYL